MSVPMVDLRAEYYSLKKEIDAAIQRVFDPGFQAPIVKAHSWAIEA